jgi:NAD+ diphosphatase
MQHTSNFGPWPRLAYVGSPLERASERRSDAEFVAAASAHPGARAVAIGGELVVLRKGADGDPLLPVGEINALGAIAEPVFLGVVDGAARLGFAIAPETAERLKQRDDYLVSDLRSIAVQGLVPPELLQPIATAKALLTWHLRHRFCPNCGAATRASEAGWRRDCPACGTQQFPRTDPCVIMLAIQGEQCLLARSARFVPSMWSCLAGFVEPGESFEEAVRRETREEVGVTIGRVRYLASQPWPFPMSLMIGCYAEAVSNGIEIDRNEVEDARWVGREEAALMLARKHPEGLIVPPPAAIAHHILRGFVERGPALLNMEREEP